MEDKLTEKIVLRNIKKSFGTGDRTVHALQGVNLSIKEGEMVAVMGKSGSGKSTLLNVLGCLVQADEGEYLFEGSLINGMRQKQLSAFRSRKIGFILQYYALLDDRTVFQNVALPLQYGRKNKDDIAARVEGLLRQLEIYDKRNNHPYELSGGKCRRTAIARALANNLYFVLADEPTGSLDSHTEATIMEMFQQMNRAGKTIIIVTHDKSVSDYCNRVVVIKDGLVQ